MDGLRDEIADLEAEIERLSEAAERCRKFIFASKAAAVLGGALLLFLAVGVVRFQATAFVASLTALLAGIALSGTNARTLQDILAAVTAREAHRRALIDRLELREIS